MTATPASKDGNGGTQLPYAMTPLGPTRSVTTPCSGPHLPVAQFLRRKGRHARRRFVHPFLFLLVGAAQAAPTLVPGGLP